MTANSAIKLLRLNDVILQVGMKRSWIFQQVKDGNFPCLTSAPLGQI